MSAATVEQWEFGAYVAMREEAPLGEVAAALGVHEATARRHLDGLVHQRLLVVVPGDRGGGRERTYYVPGQEPS